MGEFMEEMTSIEARLNRTGVVGEKRDELARILSTGPCSPDDDRILTEFRQLERQATRRRCRSLPDRDRELQLATFLAIIAIVAVLAFLPLILNAVVDN